MARKLSARGFPFVLGHAHQALGVLLHVFCKGLKPYGGVHVVKQKRPSCFEIVTEHRFDRFTEQADTKSRIALGACLYRVLKSLVCGMSVSILSSVLVVIPKCLGPLNVP